MGNEEIEKRQGLFAAIEAATASYRYDKRPVIIFDEDGEILHGHEIHRWSTENKMGVEALQISGVNRAAFESSNAAEPLEAARQEFLTGRRDVIQ